MLSILQKILDANTVHMSMHPLDILNVSKHSLTNYPNAI